MLINADIPVIRDPSDHSLHTCTALRGGVEDGILRMTIPIDFTVRKRDFLRRIFSGLILETAPPDMRVARFDVRAVRRNTSPRFFFYDHICLFG